MSGIANSTQPVAMTARGCDKERQSGLKCKRMLRKCGGHIALDHHHHQGTKPEDSDKRAKPHNRF